MRNNEVYVATLETKHFSFAAYGESETQARYGLLRGVKLHAVQYHVLPAAIRELMQDAELHRVYLGECYRDGEHLQVPA